MADNTTFIISGTGFNKVVTAASRKAAIATLKVSDNFENIRELDDNEQVHCDNIWPVNNPIWVYCPTCGDKL